MSNLKVFLAAVTDDWIGKMSGGVGLLLTVIGFVSPAAWQRWLFLAMGVLALFYSCYNTWLKEYRKHASADGINAAVSLSYEHNDLFLCVLNTGPAADFYATIRVPEGVRGLTGSEFARWTHTNTVKTQIPRGGQFRAKLAHLEWRDGMAQWHVLGVSEAAGVVEAQAHYSSCVVSEPLIKAPDLIVSGDVFAEPDLREGPIPYQLALGAFGVGA
jgi:hypothetical protein